MNLSGGASISSRGCDLFFREEVLVQAPHGFRDLVLAYNKTDVNFRGALRNHPNVHTGFCHGIEDACRNPGLPMYVFAH